ncbi:MAG: metal-dependent hydrolase [Patescibacteria group bacterium]|nr:metal-dependent hydrolase [Patescibacteria group bacterium]MDD5294551.1 metal-dependent hydrolase [Patescibacteria group bacterium]MDD5554648.1 metal-dependent hydrolase [Patescibacteria group bacterium]
MPLLLSHTLIGFVIKQFGFKRIFNEWWKTFVLIAFFSCLPDIVDFPLGFLLDGNGNAFHYGFTHTIYFAFVGGLAGGWLLSFYRKMSWLSWRSYWVNFLFCFLLVSSHSLADFISTDNVAYFFHLGGVDLSGKYLSPAGFIKLFFNYNSQELSIMGVCLLAIFIIQRIKFLLKKRRDLRLTGEFETAKR